MKKETKYKAGIIFGIVMSLYFVSQDFITHHNLTAKAVIIIIISGLLGGALAGLIFGSLIGLFTNSKLIAQTTKIETKPDEAILHETNANHFKGVEGVGGKLYLTNKRLVFKSHKLNIQNHELSIRLSDIKKVAKYKTLGIINNGLSVTTCDKNIERFVVKQIDEWIIKLSKNY